MLSHQWAENVANTILYQLLEWLVLHLGTLSIIWQIVWFITRVFYESSFYCMRFELVEWTNVIMTDEAEHNRAYVLLQSTIGCRLMRQIKLSQLRNSTVCHLQWSLTSSTQTHACGGNMRLHVNACIQLAEWRTFLWTLRLRKHKLQ